MMNVKSLVTSLFLGSVLFAAFSSSPNYQLKSYTIGPGATNSAQSTTYHAQATVGEQNNGTTSSANYVSQNGSIQAEQLNIPPPPSLSNGGGIYYNKLQLIINTGGNPSDSTYAVAVSTNNFTYVEYVQTDGTLGPSPVYQSYTAWGGAGGSYIVGLTASTAYQVKVAAMEGMYTNTNFGNYTSQSTVAPSITFSESSNALNLGNLLPGAIVVSPSLNINLTTNAVDGGSVYISGTNQGLKSISGNYVIPAYSGDLASVNQGFGLQALSSSETSGGPMTIDSSYDVSGYNVEADSIVPQQIFNSLNPIVNGLASVDAAAKVYNDSPSANDYQEVLTFIASANF